MTFADPSPLASDFKRDRWGRPLVVPPGGGKPQPYARASGFGAVLEDGFGLSKWTSRTVGIGVALNQHLQAAIAACPPSDTRRLDELVEQALQAAGAKNAADLGSALHQFRERMHAGEIKLTDVPEPWRGDLAAYVACLDAHGLTEVPGLNEAKVVNDRWKAAGTFDLALEDSQAVRVLSDLKTGKSAGRLKELLQLYVYATGVLYDVETGERTPIGVVDTHGYIVHLPAGSGTCSLLRVDFDQAHELADLAVRVKELQRVRSWAVALTPATDRPPAEAMTPPPVAPQVGTAEPSRAELVAQVPTSPDEGGDADPAAFDAMRGPYSALSEAGGAWLHRVRTEAAHHAVDFHATAVKSVRRFEILRGLVALAGTDSTDGERDEVARAAVAAAVGSTEWPWFPTVSVGHVVGAMTAAEAERFATYATAFAVGAIGASIDQSTNRLTLHPAA